MFEDISEKTGVKNKFLSPLMLVSYWTFASLFCCFFLFFFRFFFFYFVGKELLSKEELAQKKVSYGLYN